MTISLTRQAVQAVLNRSASPLDEAVASKVKLCLADHIRGCLDALSLPWAPSVERMLAAAPDGKAMLWGASRRVSSGDAAFGNAMLAHGLIQDDMHVPSGAHIRVVVIPALLAVAQAEGLSGPALLHGIAAGYDVMARVGAAARIGSPHRHFRPSGISGAYGAAAGLIAALRLDENVAVNALGFAANFAAGLNEWPWSGGQEIFVHAGAAARAAIASVELARAGFTASEAILEGRDGLFAAFGAGPEAADVFLKGLQEGRSILDVAYKPFPGCNYIQSPVAAVLKLREEGDWTPESVEAITIRTFRAARSYPGCDYAGPFTAVVQAKMSIQFGVAAALAYGNLDEAAFLRLDDPTVLRLLDLMQIETVPEFDRRYPGQQPAEVLVKLNSGEVRKAGVDDVPWRSPQVVEAQLQAASRARSGERASSDVASALQDLGTVPNLHPLFKALELLAQGRAADSGVGSARTASANPGPSKTRLKVGVIGAGFIGRAIAAHAMANGHEVMISNSRGPGTLGSTIVALGCRAGTVEEAAKFGDVVAVAIPFRNIDTLPADALAGKIVLDANNYYPHRDGAIDALDRHETTTSEMLAKLLPGAKVVKAFNAILQNDLTEGGTPPGTPGRRALPIAGDDARAKHVAAGLLNDFGYDTVDAGPLVEGWRFERAMPAYCVPLDQQALRGALAAAQCGIEVPHGSWRLRDQAESTL